MREPDLLDLLGDFENTSADGKELVHVGISRFPVYLHGLVEAVGAATTPSRSNNIAGAFAIQRGLKLIGTRREVESIGRCRERAAATDQILWFNSFPFEIDGLHLNYRRFWVWLPEKTRNWATSIAHKTGLQANQVYMLAVMATLVQIPSAVVPHDRREHMKNVLVSFLQRLQQRAAEAEERMALLPPAVTASTGSAVTWEAIEADANKKGRG